MRIRNAVLALLCTCIAQQAVMAHPGHAVETESSHGLVHYFTHPDHLAQWLIVAIAIAVGVLMIRNVKRAALAYARKD